MGLNGPNGSVVYDRSVSEQEGRPARPARTDSREAAELRALRVSHPELADAVDLHLEILEVYRRIQGRVPLPSLEISAEVLTRHQAEGRPVLRFEDIPLDLTDLRLLVRQIADVLRRHGALEEADAQQVQMLGRDMKLVTVAGQWYRNTAEQHAVAAIGVGHGSAEPAATEDAMIGQVLTLAMRPFLSRCAEVLQQRPELALWTHPYCAVCGGEPDLSVITPAAERHLICGRCTLRWNYEPLTCPYCQNRDRARITSFATPDGQYRVYACDVCQRYLKAYDARRAARHVMPMVDSVATLPLDAAAMQRGYSS
jgi:formate dehydrogenase maturation protein FdhE